MKDWARLYVKIGGEVIVPPGVPRAVPCDICHTIHDVINIHVDVTCHVDCCFPLRIQIACASFD